MDLPNDFNINYTKNTVTHKIYYISGILYTAPQRKRSGDEITQISLINKRYSNIVYRLHTIYTQCWDNAY